MRASLPSARQAKALEALLKQDSIGSRRVSTRYKQFLLVEPLKRMAEGRSIVFVQDVASNLNDVVGANPEDLCVECSMVDGAHGDTVRDDWLTTLSVLLDVSRIKKLRVSKPTQRTLSSVGE